MLQNDYGLNLLGLSLHQASAISDDGRSIAGTSDAGPFLAQIPEPSTLRLLALGVAAVLAMSGRAR